MSCNSQADRLGQNEKVVFGKQSGIFQKVKHSFISLFSFNLSEECKKGWAERKAQGLYCGLLPFGAMKGEDEVPVPHPDTYPGLVRAFELAAQGESDKKIA